MTVVFQIVPGAFTEADWYNGLRDALIGFGHEAFVTRLLTSGRRDPLPPATMQEDADKVRAEALTQISQGKSLILVAHSYGGAVVTEASRGLLNEDQANPSTAGGLVRIVYMTSLMLAPGQSTLSVFGGKLPPFLVSDGNYITHDPEGSAKVTFSDLPLEEGIASAKTLLPHSALALAGEVTYPAYKFSPVSYIVCTKDNMLPVPAQRSMIEAVETNWGRKVDITELKTGHNPHTAMPEGAAKAIVGICGL